MKSRILTATIVRMVGVCTLTAAIGVVFGNATGDEVMAKQVTFYTTYGYRLEQHWTIPLRIWVSKRPHKVRRLASKGARKIVQRIAALDTLTEQQKHWFKYRSEDFFADSKSRQQVEFVFDDDPQRELFRLEQISHDGEGRTVVRRKTDRNGLIESTVTLSSERVIELMRAQQSVNGWLSFSAVSEDHSGKGWVRMLEPEGLSVISDVDDTIKITEIPSGEATVMRNTFFSEFRAAPCMAAMYHSFDETTAFHYVSGGPWQMYTPLSEFLFGEALFPPGSFHMKNVRTNPFESESYDDFRKLAGGSESATEEQKLQQIVTLFTHFPQRQFLLIGDSGEKDPEIFQRIKKEHAEQVREIRIRDVVNAKEHAPERLADIMIIDPDQHCQ